MTKLFADMSIEELETERAEWQRKIDEATSWGAALGAAAEWRDECDRQIRLKKARSC